MQFKLRLSEVTSSDVSISYEVIGVTAEPGVDFEAQSSTIIIPSGQRTTNINVITYDDDINEISEKIELLVTNVVNAKTGTTRVIGIINDNDQSTIRAEDGYTTANDHYGYNLAWEMNSRITSI